jgi:hypothetical protein
MKNFTMVLLATALMTACGGGSTETTTHDAHEGHNHDAAPTGAPAVPAVPPGASVYFANLEDGATVSSPVYVEFGAKGINVEPAGPVNEGYGHHHVIIDGSPTPAGEGVPADETHIHYGLGQTSDTLVLSPGTHTLTLQFADGLHRSYGAQMSAQISVTVE